MTAERVTVRKFILEFGINHSPTVSLLLITHEGISVAIGAAVGGITNAAAGATAVISSEKVEVREILSVLGKLQ